MTGMEILTTLERAAKDLREYSDKLTHYRNVCMENMTTADDIYEDLQLSVTRSIFNLDTALTAIKNTDDVNFDAMPRDYIISHIGMCKAQLMEIMRGLTEIRSLVVKIYGHNYV